MLFAWLIEFVASGIILAHIIFSLTYMQEIIFLTFQLKHNNKTNQESYLTLAYNAVLDNVTNLLHEQQDLNTTYLAKMQEVAVPKGATKEKISRTYA